MPEVVIRKLERQPTVVMRGKVAVKVMPQFLGMAFEAAAAHAEEIGTEICGPPFARYRPLDSEFREFEVEAGFPVNGEPTASEEVDASSLPAGPAAVAIHVGPYDAMVPTYDAIAAFLREQRAEAFGPAWEVYLADSKEECDPAAWRTEIVQPFMT